MACSNFYKNYGSLVSCQGDINNFQRESKDSILFLVIIEGRTFIARCIRLWESRNPGISNCLEGRIRIARNPNLLGRFPASLDSVTYPGTALGFIWWQAD
jgi:hypothetical protein